MSDETAAARERIATVDVVKGVGIVAVAIRHISSGFPQALMMAVDIPLFFFLSGYLFTPRIRRAPYFLDKSISLLLPYVVFTLLIHSLEYLDLGGWKANADASVTQRVIAFVMPMIVGGRALKGWCAVAWFIPVLFMTQQLANLLFTRLSERTLAMVIVLSLMLAYANSQLAPQLWLPLNANAVLMALPLFYAGYLYRNSAGPVMRKWAVPIALAALALIILDVPLGYDIKYAKYGVPGVSVLSAVAMTIALISLCSWAVRFVWFAGVANALGVASLVIMFVHLPVQLWMRDTLQIDLLPRLFASLALGYFAYACLRSTAASRALFLGSKHDLLRLLHWPKLPAEPMAEERPISERESVP